MPSDHSQLAVASLLAAVVGLLVGGVACGGKSDKKRDRTYQFPVTVKLSDKEGNAVAEAPVKLDGNVVGYTDREGKFHGNLREKPGKEIELALGELDGYRYVDGASVKEVLELKPSLSGKGRKGVEVLLHAKAESIKRHYLIWLKAVCEAEELPDDACQGLDVKRNGEVVAETDHVGTAHFEMRKKNGEPVEVTVESPRPEDDDGPKIAPKNPTYTFETDLESTVYLLEPTFQEADDEDDDGGDHRRRRIRRDPDPSPSGGGGGGSAADDSGAGDSSSSGGGSDESESGGSKSESGENKNEKDKAIDLFGN